MPLLVIATPIGNRQDLSVRAVLSLKAAAVIYDEDTRHSRPLLVEHGIDTPLRSFHDHSSSERVAEVVARALRETVALISDAGTPAISDPGYRVVRALREAGGEVIPIPGASAVIAFLSASGLPTDRFSFVGFAPRKAGARATAIARWLGVPETTVCYESPNRLVTLLGAIAAQDPEREITEGREMTKKFEEFVWGAAVDVAAEFASRERVRGEIVVGVRGAPDVSTSMHPDQEAWVRTLAATSLRSKEIARIVAERLGTRKTAVYEAVLRQRAGSSGS